MHHANTANCEQVQQIDGTVGVCGNEALLAVLSRDASGTVVVEEGVETCAGDLDVVGVGDRQTPGGCTWESTVAVGKGWVVGEFLER